MKKTALSIVLILSLVIPSIFVVGMANSAPTYPIPTGPPTPPEISMVLPSTTTYVSWFVPLQFSVNGSWDGYLEHCSVEYSLDDGSLYVVYDRPFRFNALSQEFSTTLGPLSEGMHHLQVFATVGGAYQTSPNGTTINSNDFTSQASVFFTVNTTGQAQISILSPQNETYNINRMIPVEFTVNRTDEIVNLGYTLDEQSNVTITIPRNTSLYGPLSDGLHTLRVYSVFSDILPVSSTVNFTVDTTAPYVSILSLQNKEYSSYDLPLTFTVNETTSLITYLLDGKVFTIDGNTTLAALQNGNHTLKVYATDMAGNAGASQEINFNVKAPLPSEVAFGILPPMAIVLIGGLSVLIYLEKRKSATNKH